MTDRANDNLVLFPKTLDYYQITLTKMLETERYGDAKGLLDFLLQCGGEAIKHHTEWQALQGWLEAAFPDAVSGGGFSIEDDDLDEQQLIHRHANERSAMDEGYLPKLIATLRETNDPEQQMLVIGQLAHLSHPEVELALREWLAAKERHPSVQFRALQALRNQGGIGAPVLMWREGETILVEVADTPLSFSEFPPAVLNVLDKVSQAAEISDPTLSYFAEEMWKECVQAAYGSTIYRSMIDDADTSSDVWAAALHQLLMERLHSQIMDDEIREYYGITEELRFRYEQAIRWLRQYSAEPPKVP